MYSNTDTRIQLRNVYDVVECTRTTRKNHTRDTFKAQTTCTLFTPEFDGRIKLWHYVRYSSSYCSKKDTSDTTYSTHKRTEQNYRFV